MSSIFTIATAFQCFVTTIKESHGLIPSNSLTSDGITTCHFVPTVTVECIFIPHFSLRASHSGELMFVILLYDYI